MRRITIITAALVALTAASPASAALRAWSCGKSCSTFSANGDGQLSVVGSGAEWGTIERGTVWVRDRTGRTSSKKWVQGSGLHWKWLGRDGWKVTSKHKMTVNANGKFWVKFQGPDIAASAVVDGSGKIGGTGHYTLNGHRHSWPHQVESLRF
jgi:hypothetical protein